MDERLVMIRVMSDLIPRFIGILSDVLANTLPRTDESAGGFRKRIVSVNTRLKQIEHRAIDYDDYYESKVAVDDLDWLFDMLDAYAPSGLYFGMRARNTIQYGYWAHEEPETSSGLSASVIRLESR